MCSSCVYGVMQEIWLKTKCLNMYIFNFHFLSKKKPLDNNKPKVILEDKKSWCGTNPQQKLLPAATLVYCLHNRLKNIAQGSAWRYFCIKGHSFGFLLKFPSKTIFVFLFWGRFWNNCPRVWKKHSTSSSLTRFAAYGWVKFWPHWSQWKMHYLGLLLKPIDKLRIVQNVGAH